MRREAVPVRIPMVGGGAHEAVIVILEAGGLTGLGEATALTERGHTLEALMAELAGDAEPEGGPARFALETARADLEARVQNLPLAALLGGVRRRAVRSSRLIRSLRPAAVAAEVEAARGAGFTTFKLKSGGHGTDGELERAGAARYAAGPDASLRLDLNGRLSLEQAVSLLPALQRFRLEFVEQPLPVDAPLADWLELESRAWWPLYADESLADRGLASELGRAGIGFAIKLATVGGWSGFNSLTAEFPAGQFLIGSSFETSIGLAAAVHLACSTERPMPDCGLATRDFLEGDLGTGLEASGPWIALPEGPGLGVELDPAGLARYRLDR